MSPRARLSRARRGFTLIELLVVITIIGMEFAFLMGGLVVTEQVFNLNGLGRLLVQSVTFNDYAMTMFNSCNMATAAEDNRCVTSSIVDHNFG